MYIPSCLRARSAFIRVRATPALREQYACTRAHARTDYAIDNCCARENERDRNGQSRGEGGGEEEKKDKKNRKPTRRELVSTETIIHAGASRKVSRLLKVVNDRLVDERSGARSIGTRAALIFLFPFSFPSSFLRQAQDNSPPPSPCARPERARLRLAGPNGGERPGADGRPGGGASIWP